MTVVANSKKYISGITLIEMLIGVVISTIIMGAMYTTYNVVNQSYSKVTNKAKISRSGRDLVEMLIRDIRMAGFKYFLGTSNAINDNPEENFPERTYLQFLSGNQPVHESHDPIIIIKDELGYDIGRSRAKDPPELTDWELLVDDKDVCCDKIHIVYDDFSQHDPQPYKRYKVTYYAKPVIGGTTESPDKYYSIFKSVELWEQERLATGVFDVDEVKTGKWTSDTAICEMCYFEEKIRDHVVDMEFVAFDKDGIRLASVRSDDDSQPKIYEIRSVDVRLTFRSKGTFFRFANKKIIQGLGTRATKFTDRYLRDSVVVTIYTRNIGT